MFYKNNKDVYNTLKHFRFAVASAYLHQFLLKPLDDVCHGTFVHLIALLI